MSRVGKEPIPVGAGVKVQVQGESVEIAGPKGKLLHRLPAGLALEQGQNQLHLKRQGNETSLKSLHGLHRTLLYNMVKGVTDGYVKELELIGVGYRAQVSGSKLELFVGLTHPIIYPIPSGIAVEAPKPTQLMIKGIDKQLVGQVAARIRSFAPPEPYKGKGIKYLGQIIRRKAGKAVA